MSLKIYTVKAGKHDFFPPELRTPHLSRGLSWTWEVVFDATCRYIMPTGHQDNINKGGGFSMDVLSNKRNGVMWGWDYNVENDAVELSQYVNRNGAYEVGYEGRQMQLGVPIGSRARITITYIGKNNWQFDFAHLNADKQPIASARSYANIKTSAIVWRIGLYFGGSVPAPNDMQVWVDLKR